MKLDIIDISEWRDMYFLFLIIQQISSILGNEDWTDSFWESDKNG